MHGREALQESPVPGLQTPPSFFFLQCLCYEISNVGYSSIQILMKFKGNVRVPSICMSDK